MSIPTVVAIHVAKGRRLPMHEVAAVVAEAGKGLVGDRVAAPCKLLDDTIGRGAQEALRHRGGSVFRVLEGGEIRVGDEVRTEVSPDPGTDVGTRPGQARATTSRVSSTV